MTMTMDELDMAKLLPSNILSDVQSFAEDHQVYPDDGNILVDVVSHLYLEKFLPTPNILLDELVRYENTFAEYNIPGYSEEYGLRIASYILRDAFVRLLKLESAQTLSEQVVSKYLPEIMSGYGRYLAFAHALNVSLGEYPHDQLGIHNQKEDEWHTWPDYFIDHSQNVSWKGLIDAWQNHEVFSLHQKFYGDIFGPHCFLASVEAMCDISIVQELFPEDRTVKRGLFGSSKKKTQTLPYTDSNLVEKYLQYFN